MIKQLMIFVAGTLFGGGAATVYIKKRYIKDHYVSNEEHDAQLNKQAAYYEKRLTSRRRFNRTEPIGREEGPDVVDPMTATYKKPERQPYRDSFKTAMAEETKAESEHPVEVDPPDAEHLEEYSQGLALSKSRSNNKKPKLIKASDFGSDFYDTCTLLYYVENGVLTTEDDEVYGDLDEVEAMLGECLRKYGFDNDDAPSIYVRNPNQGVDYEIIKVFSSFNDG